MLLARKILTRAKVEFDRRNRNMYAHFSSLKLICTPLGADRPWRAPSIAKRRKAWRAITEATQTASAESGMLYPVNNCKYRLSLEAYGRYILATSKADCSRLDTRRQPTDD